MRRVLFKVGIAFTCLGIAGFVWILAGRPIALWLDGLGTTEVSALSIKSLIYDGTESGGTFRIGDMLLDTSAPDNRAVAISVRRNADGSFVMTKGEKSFLLGKSRPANPAASHEFIPESDDELILTTRRSFLSWPTPFDFNFMSGHSPSWKRHVYYRLRWKKQNGTKLRMVWRFEQYYYPSDGWAGGFMTHEATTGLIRVDIEN